MAQAYRPDKTQIPEAAALNPGSGSVILTPSYALAASFLALGGATSYQGDIWFALGFPSLLIGLLLTIQTSRLRFVFGPEKLSVAVKKGPRIAIMRSFSYDQITNWELWWKQAPLLFYFKETESYDGRGGPHFIPVIFDAKQLLQHIGRATTHLDKHEYF